MHKAGRRQKLQLKDLPIKQLQANGADFRYFELGNGEPVVFVHGAVADLRIWLEQVEHLSESYRAISYSRRMHWPAVGVNGDQLYTRASHAGDLAAFLRALDLKRVHLVGHSFGGAVALLTALVHPELVASLTLGEPSPFLGLFDVSELDLLSKQKVGFDEACLLAKRASAEAAIRQFLTVIVGADVLDQLSPTARVIILDNAPSLAPMLEHYFESPTISLRQWEEFTVPTLLISGEFSPKIAHVSNDKLHGSLSNSRTVVLSSASHGLHIENPEEFNSVLSRFLKTSTLLSGDS